MKREKTRYSNLETVTQEITSGMNEMASGADQINTAEHMVTQRRLFNVRSITQFALLHKFLLHQ
jgi:hypothetical protein